MESQTANYSYKPTPLRGPAHALSFSTTRHRPAVRLYSGAIQTMKHHYLLFLTTILSACTSVPISENKHENPLTMVESLAKAGDRGAILDLCYRFTYGRGARLDYQTALTWCKKGAEFGVENCQVLLAEMYYNGQGTPIDYANALIWYRTAAALGHEHAFLMLYYLYNDGSGIPSDRNLALSYLKVAADAGYQLAKDEMAKQHLAKKP